MHNQSEEIKPGRYERIGLWYFFRLSQKDKKRGIERHSAGDDKELVWSVRRVTFLGILIVFIIGGISAGGSVFVELKYKNADLVIKYSWLIGVTAGLTIIEFIVLFWVSIRTVFFLSRITGHNLLTDDNKLVEMYTPNLLARAALEIPDPVRHLLGVDPTVHISKKKILIIGILYKVKIALSNVLAKLFLRRVIGKSFLRVSIAYISVIITGLWNSFVIFKVVREARLRLFGNLIAKYLVEEVITNDKLARLSRQARIGCLQAVGNAVVFAQRYHPNMMILLSSISNRLGINNAGDIDNWDNFLKTLHSISEDEKYFLLDLLCVATAFDGKVSRLEKKMLVHAFDEYYEIYFQRIKRLKNLLLQGKLNEAKQECLLDFEPG